MNVGDEDGGHAVRPSMGSGLTDVIFRILTAPHSVCFLFRDLSYYLTAPRLKWTYTVPHSWGHGVLRKIADSRRVCQKTSPYQRFALGLHYSQIMV